MATTEIPPESEADAHGHGHDHDHPAWLAHHFDTPEQQFDSGKLGIWLFLVTEVLFFSGMFCAYAIFRMLRPDVFVGCSEFLNTQLGAINTGVLLFSSLTMAWAVRCAQLEQHKLLAVMLATTLSCAMIFLGVKSIEYSHKWEMGLLPAGLFSYDPAFPHGTGDHPNYLFWLCFPFGLLTAGTALWAAWSKISKNDFHFEVAKPLTVVCLNFFIGVGLGMVLESGESADHAAHSAVHDDVGHDHETLAAHDAGTHEHEDENHDHDHGMEAADPSAALAGLPTSEITKLLAMDPTNTGLKDELDARTAQASMSTGGVLGADESADMGIESAEAKDVMTQSQAGVFFGIYYCMTGVHAIHILAGIGVLVWLLVRAIRQDFNRQYFGPVDYVGLYWHLVDLIWIYLFPLLYLIR
ncbi:MAG: cytochrome c oxidase subunit 3 [Planctomycetota bacterium]